MSNNLTAEHPEKIVNSSDDIIQITDNFNRLYSENGNKSKDFINEIVKEMFNLYNEERLKGKNYKSAIDKWDQFLAKKNQNPDKIVNWCLDNQIIPMAQIILANCYRFGKWVEKDENKAFIYFKGSADMKDAEGILGVGVCYFHGIGVEKDKSKAFIYYQKSAQMGNSNGMCSVGYSYLHGVGVEKDEHIALVYYQNAADMGNAGGTCSVGYCYQHGIGVEKDEHKAFIYYQKSAEMDNAAGMSQVGYCYLHGIGIEKDERKAFIYYQKFAEMDDAVGMCQVGYCYQNGIGVEKDEYKAFIYYQKSADAGNKDGTCSVGSCYKNGIGVEKDEYKAFIYYKKSAEMGNAQGIFNVGNCYEHGIGVEEDEHKAFIYYKRSAEMGNAGGMSKVGYFYRNGIGVKRDLQEATNWYQRERSLTSDKDKWILKNSDIDDDLKNMLIENKYKLFWISYDEFKNVKKIGKGGFATVYVANWLDKSQILFMTVALKLLHKSNASNKEFIKELKAYCDICHKHPTFLKCFGISKDNISKDYILVMEYAAMGSLNKNLHSIAQMEWEKKLNLLLCIASDLKIIHSQDLIHRDLHSGNILQNDLHSAYITDLGLSISTNMNSKSKNTGVYGVLPYIAPEVLNGKSYTKASDIYSFGIIMWEILYGRPVPFDQNSELQSKSQFHLQVCDGLRPQILEGTASCYINLMERCWDAVPENRPSAVEIYDIFTEWQNNKNILLELSESDKKIQRIENDYMETCIENYRSKLILHNNIYQDTKLQELEINELEINESEINQSETNY